MSTAAEFERNVSLASLNTFGFVQHAARLVRASSEERLVEALVEEEDRPGSIVVLGGGSNIVLTRDLHELVVMPGNERVQYDERPDGSTLVAAGAALSWHALVRETLAAGLGGLENLSLIPGTVGAAPVQNIGAYGVELSDRLLSVRAFHRPSRRFLQMATEDCEFGYRSSRFKREAGDWVITEIVLRLHRSSPLVLTYAGLREALDKAGIDAPDHRTVAAKVEEVRRTKLPDPSVIGNAGSFFKNPVVPKQLAEELLARYPNMPTYSAESASVKLAAGWLIDRLGFRGHRSGTVGVHDRQALVLVNYGGGTGTELLSLARTIQDAVAQTFGVTLEVEPVIL